MKIKRKKGFFSISAVAKMFSIHQQTIRLYEKEGLISPKRSGGNTRLFSEEDIDQLEEIIYLTHQLGINLAGVDMVLNLKKQISKMQKDMNKLFEQTQAGLSKEVDRSKALAKESVKDLLLIQKGKKRSKNGTTRQDEAVVLPVPQLLVDQETSKEGHKIDLIVDDESENR